MDNTALVVNFFWVECQSVCPIVQDKQTGIYNSIADDRHVVNVVNSFVYGSISIQIFTETYTDTFQIAD